MQRDILSGTRFFPPGMKLELMPTGDPIISLHKIRLSAFPVRDDLQPLVVQELADLLSTLLRRTGCVMFAIGWEDFDDRNFMMMDLIIA